MRGNVLFHPVVALKQSNQASNVSEIPGEGYAFHFEKSPYTLIGYAHLVAGARLFMIRSIAFLSREQMFSTMKLVNSFNASSYTGFLYVDEVKQAVVWQYSIILDDPPVISQQVIDTILASAVEAYDELFEIINTPLQTFDGFPWWALTDRQRPS